MNLDDDKNLPATQAPKPRKNAPHLWQPGQSGNLNGRPAGSPNRFSSKFLHSLSKSWEKHGDKVLDQVRRKDPTQFLRVCASLIPKQIMITTETRAPAELTQAELEAVIVEDISRLELLRSVLEPLIDRVAELDPILADEMRMVLNGN